MNGLGRGIRVARRALQRLTDPRWTLAGVGLGLLGGAAGAWLAQGLGPAAVVLLVVAFGLAIGAAGRSMRLVAPGHPREVPVAPRLPPPRLEAGEQEDEAASPNSPFAEEAAAAAGQVAAQRDLGIEMVELPGGPFWMGSDKSRDADAWDQELPRRKVRLSPFAIAAVPVTRGLWRRVMAGADSPGSRSVPKPWADGGDDLPATHVSWFDCLAFCNALSELSGRSPCYRGAGDFVCDWSADGYRLPTEAEWEYACRGGRETRWFWGDDQDGAEKHAWYFDNSGGNLQGVGQKKPNAFGLYDMSGNCWEWCWDWYGGYDAQQLDDPRGPGQGRQRVLRGGSFGDVPWVLRSAVRDGVGPEFRDVRIGFRCVRSGAPSSGP